ALPGREPAPTAAAPFPLDGLRVLDLSRVLSGPLVGRALADLGADVVKVEGPDGDLVQLYGEVRAGRSGFYAQQNSGKRAIAVDLGVPGAAGVVAHLAACADVVIENFRPGVADRLGIGWPALSVANPRLVMLSISGFGQDDPAPARGAFAAVIHAASGLVARQAARDGAAPVDPMLSIADTLAGLHGLVAVLAALRLRDRTGTGQWIDLAMLDAMVASDEYAHHYLDDSVPARLGGIVWPTADGLLMVAADLRHTWRRLATAHGLTDGCGPDADLDAKIAAREAAVRHWLAGMSRAEARAAIEAAGVLCTDVVAPQDAYRSADVRRRSMVARVDAGDGSLRPVIQTPYRFSAASSGVRHGPPGRVSTTPRSCLTGWDGATTSWPSSPPSASCVRRPHRRENRDRRALSGRRSPRRPRDRVRSGRRPRCRRPVAPGSTGLGGPRTGRPWP